MFRKEEIEGKVVVEASGKALGSAKDIAFGLDGSVALIVVGGDNAEIQISTDRVEGVADYIVVRREQKGETNPNAAIPVQAPTAAAACRKCGAPLRAGAKFCTKCGTAVQG